NAPLAPRPVARRQIVQHLHQPVIGERRLHRLLVEGIGEQELHSGKARPPCLRKPLEKRHFAEHHGQIGGKSRHRSGLRLRVQSSMARAVGASSGSTANSSNSTTALMSAPIEMLVTRSRMNSI